MYGVLRKRCEINVDTAREKTEVFLLLKSRQKISVTCVNDGKFYIRSAGTIKLEIRTFFYQSK